MNNITDISMLSQLKNLNQLDLDGNPISNPSVLGNLTNLKSLSMISCGVKDISFLSNLTNLEHLNLLRNKITNIDSIISLNKLKSLNIANNMISDISPINTQLNLRSLTFNNNQIKDISSIKNLRNLTFLDISNNIITDITALKDMINLEKLYAAYNKISDISSLSALTNLTTMFIERNYITDISPLSSFTKKFNALRIFEQYLPDVEINYPYKFISKDIIKDIDGSIIPFNLNNALKKDGYYYARENDNYAHLGWRKKVKIGQSDAFFSGGRSYNKKNYILNISNPSTKVEEGYFRITFNEGTNGSIQGTKIFDVLSGVPFSKIPIPDVKPDLNFKFLGWNPNLLSPDTPITKAYEFNAEYKISDPIERIAGNDRFLTAVEISKHRYKNSQYIVLVNAFKFPDALTASVLADIIDAPILLTRDSTIPKETTDEIKRLGAQYIVIVGGTTVIDPAVENELSSSYNTLRLGGKDRYETSRIIGKQIIDITNDKSKLIFTRGDEFADALSVSSLALKGKNPILLTRSNSLEQETFDLVNSIKPTEIVIVGGEKAVSNSVESKLKIVANIVRLAGNNRYETSSVIASYAYKGSQAAILASGEDFVDAMVSSILTTKYKSPILLVRKNSLPNNISDFINLSSIKFTKIIGGINAISKDTENAISLLLK